MDVALVNNPDGSAAVVVPADKSQTRPARVYPPVETKSYELNFKNVTNPFEELEQTHVENLQVMKKQDAAAWAEHDAADPVSLRKINLAGERNQRLLSERGLLPSLTITVLPLTAGVFKVIPTRCIRYSISRDFYHL
jgi:hypothetical protein